MPDMPPAQGTEGAGGVRGRLGIRKPVSSGTLFAIAVSLFVHVVISLVAALAVLQGGGGADAGMGEVELAIMSDEELTEMVRGELAVSQMESEALPVEENFPTVDSTMEASIDALASLSSESMSDVQLIGGGAGDIDSDAALDSSVSGGAASFFGVEARGSRFAYIIDVSGSMDDARMSALKREVITSIGGLLNHAKFTVVTYSNESESLTGSKWFVAEDSRKREIEGEVAALRSGGSTVPSGAFTLVSMMRPRADAIYFMTDGKIDGREATQLLQRINMMNRAGGTRTRVHCITFIDRDSEKLMRRIARMTGGTYTHIPGGSG